MPTLIPYVPGRSRLTERIVATLNSGGTYMVRTAADVTAMAALLVSNPTLIKAMPYINGSPAALLPYELGAPVTNPPRPSTVVLVSGGISQVGAAIPTLDLINTGNLALVTHRTSAGFYTITGFPTGYTILAYCNSPDVNRAVQTTVAAQTVTVKSYSGGVAADDVLFGSKIAFVLVHQ